jgi:hypothetical protein
MLDVRRPDLFRVLTKNPNIFCIEAELARTRYNALHRVLPLSHEQVNRLVTKYPIILNYETHSVETTIDSLRQASYTRTHWQDEFDNITPSFVAFYFKDSKDLLTRCVLRCLHHCIIFTFVHPLLPCHFQTHGNLVVP